MRELKFRAWSKSKNKFWNPDFIDCDGQCWDTNHVHETLPTDDYILMQFTGLRDKNGKDIYDGDILNQYPGFGCEWNKRMGVVKYQFASFWFDMGAQAFTLDDHDCRFEIIGNIYENHELIKA